jgi:hypothetical protein
MFGQFPGLFLSEFGGYWENEPGNVAETHYINPNHIIIMCPHKRDANDKVTHYAMHILEQEYPLIVSADDFHISGATEADLQIAN